jgi:hypothetical protein
MTAQVAVRTPARVRPGWHRVSLIAIVTAIVAGLALQPFGDVDPVNEMISDTVGSPVGALLLGLACAALAVTAGALAVGAGRARHLRTRVLHGLLALWSVALLAVAVFPTNLPGTELTDSAVVHRYGAAVVAAVPPVIGLLVARSRRLRTASLITSGGVVLFALAHGPAVLFGSAVLPYAGLAERILFVLILVVLMLTARDLADHSEEATSWT